MKVIFLDFDGVLNSAASFIRVSSERKKLTKEQKEGLPPVSEHLDPTCASNFQYILKHCKDDVKIVISSTWRELFSLDWLKEHLAKYGIDSSRVIDRTPSIFRFGGSCRGAEINEWLNEHKEVTDFVIIDDNYIGSGHEENEKVVATHWYIGLTLPDAVKALDILKEDSRALDIPI